MSDTVHCGDLPWFPLADNVSVRIIKIDPETGKFSVIIRATRDAVLPRHRHIESAEIYIIRGHGIHPQTGTYREGDYVSERKGAIHDALRFAVDTELLMICEGPSEFIDQTGNPLYRMDAGFLQGLMASQGRA
jgi:hypothetical protein